MLLDQAPLPAPTAQAFLLYEQELPRVQQRQSLQQAQPPVMNKTAVDASSLAIRSPAQAEQLAEPLLAPGMLSTKMPNKTSLLVN